MFWREFMKTDEAQDALASHARDELNYYRDEYEKKQKPLELRELADALLDCSENAKKVVAPLLKYEFAQKMLYQTLLDCTDRDFATQLESLLPRLEKLSSEVRNDPTRGHEINEQFWRRMSDEVPDKEPPRDLLEAMNQAQMYSEMGRKKFDEKNYAVALERYSSGVDIVPSSEDELCTELRLRLLNNQAVCALKTDRWSLCVKACDAVLRENPRHLKALYRKGSALMRKGDFEQSQKTLAQLFEDFEVKSHEDAESLAEARDMARKLLAKMRSSEKNDLDFKKQMAKGMRKVDMTPTTTTQKPVVDEGLKRRVEARIAEERGRFLRDDKIARGLSLAQVVFIQRQVILTYETEEMKSADRSTDDRKLALAKAAYAPALKPFGFSVDGYHAFQRTLVARLDNEQVRSLAKKARELLVLPPQ